MYEGIRDLPGIRFRTLPDPAGELGSAIFSGVRQQGEVRPVQGCHEGGECAGGESRGVIVLPTQKHIEKKMTVHPAWPSFTSRAGTRDPVWRRLLSAHD